MGGTQRRSARMGWAIRTPPEARLMTTLLRTETVIAMYVARVETTIGHLSSRLFQHSGRTPGRSGYGRGCSTHAEACHLSQFSQRHTR